MRHSMMKEEMWSCFRQTRCFQAASISIEDMVVSPMPHCSFALLSHIRAESSHSLILARHFVT